MILYCQITTPKSIAKIVFDGPKCIKAEAPMAHLENLSFYDFTKFAREHNWKYLISSREFGKYTETLEGKLPEDLTTESV